LLDDKRHSSTTPAPLSETLSTPLGLGIAIYLLIGFLVTGFIAIRRMKLRRPPTGGLLWEKKDHARNTLFLLQGAAFMSTIGVFMWIALWPFLLLYLWASQEDDEH